MAELRVEEEANATALAELPDASGRRPGAADRAEASARRSFRLFGLGFGGIVLSLLVGTVAPQFVASAGLAASTGLLALGVGWGVTALVRIGRLDERGRGWMAALVVFLPVLAGSFFALVGAFLSIWAMAGFARGRQLRRRGKVLLAPVAAGAGWTTLSLSAAVPDELRAPLAARFRENGRTEHASVAAFARLTLDLLALGAPAKLIESAGRDSLDEIRHAELCFSIARALDGRDESPGPFPAAQRAGGVVSSRPLALAQLAVGSLIDGALHEGVSARVLARLVRRCEEPAARELLRELAADEGRHAAHGWDVVEWCLAEGGAPVAHALRGALRSLPESIDSALPEAAATGAWERYGIHGRELEAAEHAKARADLVRRTQSLIRGHLRESRALEN